MRKKGDNHFDSLGLTPKQHEVLMEVSGTKNIVEREKKIRKMFAEAKKDNSVLAEFVKQFKGDEIARGLIFSNQDPEIPYLFAGALSDYDQVALARSILTTDFGNKKEYFLARHLENFTAKIPAEVAHRMNRYLPDIVKNIHIFESLSIEELLKDVQFASSKTFSPEEKNAIEYLIQHATYLSNKTAFLLISRDHSELVKKYKNNFTFFDDFSKFGSFSSDGSLHIGLNKQKKINFLDIFCDNASDKAFKSLLNAPNIAEAIEENEFPDNFRKKHANLVHEYLKNSQMYKELAREFQSKSVIGLYPLPKDLIEKNGKPTKWSHLITKPTDRRIVSEYHKMSLRPDRLIGNTFLLDLMHNLDNPDFFLEFAPHVTDRKMQYNINLKLISTFLSKNDDRYSESLIRYAYKFPEPDLREKLEPVAQKQWKKTHDLSLLEYFPELIPVLSKKDVEKAATNGHVRLLLQHWDKAKDAGYTKEQVVDGAVKHRRYSEVAQALGALDVISPELYKTLWVELNKPENRAEAKSDPRLALALHLEKGTGYGNEVAEGLLEIGKRGQLAENLNRFSGLSQSVADRLLKKDEKTGTSFEEDVARYYSSFA